MTTAYILVAIQLEERDMIHAFGDRHKESRKRVSMLASIRFWKDASSEGPKADTPSDAH